MRIILALALLGASLSLSGCFHRDVFKDLLQELGEGKPPNSKV